MAKSRMAGEKIIRGKNKSALEKKLGTKRFEELGQEGHQDPTASGRWSAAEVKAEFRNAGKGNVDEGKNSVVKRFQELQEGGAKFNRKAQDYLTEKYGFDFVKNNTNDGNAEDGRNTGGDPGDNTGGGTEPGDGGVTPGKGKGKDAKLPVETGGTVAVDGSQAIGGGNDIDFTQGGDKTWKGKVAIKGDNYGNVNSDSSVNNNDAEFLTTGSRFSAGSTAGTGKSAELPIKADADGEGAATASSGSEAIGGRNDIDFKQGGDKTWAGKVKVKGSNYGNINSDFSVNNNDAEFLTTGSRDDSGDSGDWMSGVEAILNMARNPSTAAKAGATMSPLLGDFSFSSIPNNRARSQKWKDENDGTIQELYDRGELAAINVWGTKGSIFM